MVNRALRNAFAFSSHGKKHCCQLYCADYSELSVLLCAIPTRYMTPASGSALEQVVSLQYSVVTPLLNPFIYSLRNKEVKAALQRMLARRPRLILWRGLLCFTRRKRYRAQREAKKSQEEPPLLCCLSAQPFQREKTWLLFIQWSVLRQRKWEHLHNRAGDTAQDNLQVFTGIWFYILFLLLPIFPFSPSPLSPLFCLCTECKSTHQDTS